MKILVIAILLLSCSLVHGANASEQAAQQVVQDIFAKAADPLIASDLTKQSEISKQVDFNLLAKGALGEQANKIPKKDFDWFRDTLKQIITLTVYPRAPDFLKDVKIVYDGNAQKNDLVEVKSTVQNKSDLTDVVYFLKKDNDQAWRVVDISLSGSQWTSVIHDEVSDVLRKKKWKGLKEAMEKRLHTLQQEKL